MADYAKYRESVQISNVQMTEALSEAFPGYSKIQSAMVNAPMKYGVCLSPEAEAYLIEVFGYGAGLNTKAKKNSKVKRSKSNRMACRLDDQTYDAVKSKMAEMGLKSAQEFIEYSVKEILGGRNEKN